MGLLFIDNEAVVWMIIPITPPTWVDMCNLRSQNNLTNLLPYFYFWSQKQVQNTFFQLNESIIHTHRCDNEPVDVIFDEWQVRDMNMKRGAQITNICLESMKLELMLYF